MLVGSVQYSARMYSVDSASWGTDHFKRQIAYIQQERYAKMRKILNNYCPPGMSHYTGQSQRKCTALMKDKLITWYQTALWKFLTGCSIASLTSYRPAPYFSQQGRWAHSLKVSTACSYAGHFLTPVQSSALHWRVHKRVYRAVHSWRRMHIAVRCA